MIESFMKRRELHIISHSMFPTLFLLSKETYSGMKFLYMSLKKFPTMFPYRFPLMQTRKPLLFHSVI